MQVVIGRAPACDVVLEHLSISRQHAELTTDLAGNLFLTDLGAGACPAQTLPLCLCPCLSGASTPSSNLNPAGNLFRVPRPAWAPVLQISNPKPKPMQ